MLSGADENPKSVVGPQMSRGGGSGMDEGMNLKEKGRMSRREERGVGGGGGRGRFVTCWAFSFRASASRETQAVREDSGFRVDCCTLLVAG